jgi:hypothetical protein
MPKRFTDTDAWKDPWFQNLKPVFKLFWKYICDSCDYAGIWKINKSLAEFQIGLKVPWNEVESVFNGDKKRIDFYKDIWVIKDFISFQYGVLSNSSFHHKIRQRIDTLSTGYRQGVDTLKDKEEVKDIVNSYPEGGVGETQKEHSGNVPNWRDSFDAYDEELCRQLEELKKDEEWFVKRAKYHPGLDIRLSLEKALNDFWGTEAGWNCKKKSKSKEFDLKATLARALSFKENQVWKSKTKDGAYAPR